MQAYEDDEEAGRRAREVAKTQPDDDGFVTVNYSEAVGDRTELENVTTGASRRKGNKRSRNKKTGTGADELEDFYRFQRKENKKRTLEDLRKQFEDDLHKVKRLKEERQYRPF
jgi:ribosomal RNA-processing protein 7